MESDDYKIMFNSLLKNLSDYDTRDKSYSTILKNETEILKRLNEYMLIYFKILKYTAEVVLYYQNLSSVNIEKLA
jgi:hypothetical protein